MSLSKKQIAILHIGKSKMGWSDEMYRSALVHIAGVTSSKELDRAGFEAMMGYYDFMGFNPTRADGPDFGDRPGMASFAQCELIRQLWHEYTRGEAGSEQLNKWLMRTFKISSLRFLTRGKAGHAITALKAMKSRAA